MNEIVEILFWLLLFDKHLLRGSKLAGYKDTSLQTEESKGVLVDKLIQKYRELPPVFPTPKPTLQRLYQLYILYIQNL